MSIFYILKKRFFKLGSFLLTSKIWSIISKINNLNILIKILILLIVTIKTSKSKDQIIVFVNWYKVHNTLEFPYLPAYFVIDYA